MLNNFGVRFHVKKIKYIFNVTFGVMYHFYFYKSKTLKMLPTFSTYYLLSPINKVNNHIMIHVMEILESTVQPPIFVVTCYSVPKLAPENRTMTYHPRFKTALPITVLSTSARHITCAGECLTGRSQPYPLPSGIQPPT